jgi:hypothetical protein
VVHPPHVLLVLPLVAMVLVGSSGDCKYHTEGCGWVVDYRLVGLARGLWFYLLWLVWQWLWQNLLI